MLRLIRRFNRLQVPEDRTKSYWIYTLTEFVFIILGILIALQIDNWNTNRKEKKLEKHILSEFLIDLKDRVDVYNSSVDYHQSFIKSTEIVLDQIIHHKPYNDSLKYHFGHLYGTIISPTNSATYESLKSIGMDLIKDDNVRGKLAELFDSQYYLLNGIQMVEKDFFDNNLYESMVMELDIIEFYNEAIPLNYSELHKNNKFIQDLRMSIEIKNLAIAILKTTSRKTSELILAIEEYLK